MIFNLHRPFGDHATGWSTERSPKIIFFLHTCYRFLQPFSWGCFCLEVHRFFSHKTWAPRVARPAPCAVAGPLPCPAVHSSGSRSWESSWTVGATTWWSSGKQTHLKQTFWKTGLMLETRAWKTSTESTESTESWKKRSVESHESWTDTAQFQNPATRHCYFRPFHVFTKAAGQNLIVGLPHNPTATRHDDETWRPGWESNAPPINDETALSISLFHHHESQKTTSKIKKPL